MDFAITLVRRAAAMPLGADGQAVEAGCGWAVLCIHEQRGVEVAQHLAQFGHRLHAEAFLADLLAPAGCTGQTAAVAVECST